MANSLALASDPCNTLSMQRCKFFGGIHHGGYETAGMYQYIPAMINHTKLIRRVIINKNKNLFV